MNISDYAAFITLFDGLRSRPVSRLLASCPFARGLKITTTQVLIDFQREFLSRSELPFQICG